MRTGAIFGSAVIGGLLLGLGIGFSTQGVAGAGGPMCITDAHRADRSGLLVPAKIGGAEDPFGYCRRVGTDDDPGDVPASLTPAFVKAFGLRMEPPEVQRGASFRCDRGQVWGCVVGANLNCGKADTSRVSRGGDEWCREHPNDQMIPMAATGHATIYSWRCVGVRAVPAKAVTKVDARGFESTNWKLLNK